MKFVKVIGWLLLATFLLLALLYLILVAINWKDRPPSAAAIRSGCHCGPRNRAQARPTARR